MAGAVFIDVAAGKPLSRSMRGKVAQQEVDLLWRYKFNWIVIDRWGSEEADLILTDEGFDLPLTSLEFSADGEHFTSPTISRTNLVSVKGSSGNLPSVQVHFAKPVHCQFIRIRFDQRGIDYKVRASQRDYQLEPTDRSKLICDIPVPNKEKINSQKVRAAVIGGSNSVMRFGWVRGAELAGIDVVQNVSLGSSSNAILATQLENINATNLDVLIVNSTVNDYVPLRDSTYDLQLARHFVRSTQIWCASNNVVPVFLIYPHRRVLDDLDSGRMAFDQDAYCIELCEDLDLPYINVSELFETVAKAWGRPKREYYLDPAHLNHPTAQALGSVVGERIWRFMKFEQNQVLKDVSTKALAQGFQTIDLDPAGIFAQRDTGEHIELSERLIETSIVSQRMINLKSRTTATIDIPDGYEVVAFTMNARRCNAGIRICGENSVSRRADFGKYGGEDGFPFVCVRSFETAVQPKNGQVTIECVAPEGWFEPDEISNAVIQSIPTQELELEISQLVLRKTYRDSPFMRIRGIRLDLTPECRTDYLTA